MMDTKYKLASRSAIRALAIGWTLWIGSTTALAAWAADPDACNSPGFETVLHKSEPIAARAHWLNRQLLQWPGTVTQGQFKLYFAAKGGISAPAQGRVNGADGSISLSVFDAKLPADLAQRFKFIAEGVRLTVSKPDLVRLPALHRQQLVLVRETPDGEVLQATAIQAAGALDDLYANAAQVNNLGVSVGNGTSFRVWAPTAQQVTVCLFNTGNSAASARLPMHMDPATGVWSGHSAATLDGKYYAYLVDVFVRGVGLVRNRVTDPYSVSLTADSKRSYIADLAAPRLKPAGWTGNRSPGKVKRSTDMVVYELHLRDFSIGDATVSASNRGKYLAFTETGSNGMKHLQALANAGLTDVHLLPVFDLATVPEAGCVTPVVPTAAADSEAQQDAVMAVAARDCFNWGYDPYHYSAPEGSYASDAADGARRIIEFRQMVMALHRAGLRVGMDVVYNHTTASGQKEHSVLDRIVPGYYQRLDAKGDVERSTCCDNTATEHRMMGKLMVDSVLLWATQYGIDSFRFDLMAHQPRAVMEVLQARLDKARKRHVNLIGEGWNFGEVADGARFVQASQLSLNGSGIGTFSDRGRDAVRGGSAGDSGPAMIKQQGYINGLVHDANALADPRPVSDLLRTADMVRVGLAGSLRDFAFTTYTGEMKTLAAIDYNGQPAGYASQPSEVVNYVENHDNQTLFDANVYKLPVSTSSDDRARVQMLGVAITTFSQGVAYFHAGIDILRSKSLDRNSYDSGDWFNRLDWTYQDNFFGTGAPPKGDNGSDYALIKPLLANPAIKPTPKDIALARDMFRDFLKIRASSALFRMVSASDIKQRLTLPNTGPAQNPLVVAGHLDGKGLAGAGFREVLYFVNVGKTAQDITLTGEKSKNWTLHPVHQSNTAADRRPAEQARYEAASGQFTIPARTALVYVVK
jgi:pullulanase/glycogen debranching enzyme